jgi:hypothetical protein
LNQSCIGVFTSRSGGLAVRWGAWGVSRRVLGMPIISLAFLCACSMASAQECDLSRYDRTPPRALQAENFSARFEWGSDVDTRFDRQLWIWNYVKNKHPDASLGFRWEKGEIRRALTNPLGPGKVDCRQIFANAVNDQPDDNAPIIYGTNEQRQDAAAYVKRSVAQSAQPKDDAISVVNTSFTDSSGKLQNVQVVVISQRTDKGIALTIKQTPNVSVAMSALAEYLPAGQFDLLTAHVPPIPYAGFQEFTRLDAAKALGGMFSPEELPARMNQRYLFFPRAENVSIQIPAAQVMEVPADLIILDPKLQPLFATRIAVLVSTKG